MLRPKAKKSEWDKLVGNINCKSYVIVIMFYYKQKAQAWYIHVHAIIMVADNPGSCSFVDTWQDTIYQNVQDNTEHLSSNNKESQVHYFQEFSFSLRTIS